MLLGRAGSIPAPDVVANWFGLDPTCGLYETAVSGCFLAVIKHHHMFGLREEKPTLHDDANTHRYDRHKRKKWGRYRTNESQEQ